MSDPKQMICFFAPPNVPPNVPITVPNPQITCVNIASASQKQEDPAKGEDPPPKDKDDKSDKGKQKGSAQEKNRPLTKKSVQEAKKQARFEEQISKLENKKYLREWTRWRNLQNKIFKKLVFCSDIDAETSLLIMAFFVLYIAILHCWNWFVFHCLYIVIPYGLLLLCYVLAFFTLVIGVGTTSRILVTAFEWLMFICLVLNVLFIVAFLSNQSCLCSTVADYTQESTFVPVLFLEYYLMGIVTGFNFLISLYLMLIVADYLGECECEPDDCET